VIYVIDNTVQLAGGFGKKTKDRLGHLGIGTRELFKE
jgi:hypothetical protein